MYKTINTCFSVGAVIDSPLIQTTKDFLSRNFGSIYNIAPHITFALVPLPGYSLEAAIKDVDTVLRQKEAFTLKIRGLSIDKKNKFFFLETYNKDMLQFHTELTMLLNKHRDGFIREKDAVRIQQGIYSSDDTHNIIQYGFARVLERYQPHITLGNVSNGYSLEKVASMLQTLLNEVKGSHITINRIFALYHLDALNQSDMEVFWRKEYDLHSGQANHALSRPAFGGG